MRVIAGEFRSRKLLSAPGLDTRPTSDRLRETLFDILAPRIAGAVFLDAYAGTGAVGIEALSRGAARAIFLERSRPALEIIRKNLASLGIEDRARVVNGPVVNNLERERPDIAFLDPPYTLETEYARTLDILGRTAPPLAVAQHSKFLDLADSYGALRRYRVLKQGDNVLSFYSAPA